MSDLNAASSPPLFLLVDDDEQVRFMLSRLINRLGFETVIVGDGESALSEFLKRPGAFSAVILDLTLPGMSGLKCHHALRAIRSDVPVIVSSGSTEDEAAAQIAATPCTAILPKPFEVSELAATLSRLGIEVRI